jgi:hypothetical protein
MGCWTLHKALDADEGVNNLFSVLSVSSVVNSGELGFDAQKTARGLATRGRWDFRETFYLVSSRAAWAAARRATGTRNGEQLT